MNWHLMLWVYNDLSTEDAQDQANRVGRRLTKLIPDWYKNVHVYPLSNGEGLGIELEMDPNHPDGLPDSMDVVMEIQQAASGVFEGEIECERTG